MPADVTKWRLRAEGALNLEGTEIVIVHCGGMWPYHIHRGDACYGATQHLDVAKIMCENLVQDLIDMGLDP